MDSQRLREEFVDSLVKLANVQNYSKLAGYFGVDKRVISYWRSKDGNIDTDLTLQYFRTETINYMQALVDDLRGEPLNDESRYFEQIGRKQVETLELFEELKSMRKEKLSVIKAETFSGNLDSNSTQLDPNHTPPCR